LLKGWILDLIFAVVIKENFLVQAGNHCAMTGTGLLYSINLFRDISQGMWNPPLENQLS